MTAPQREAGIKVRAIPGKSNEYAMARSEAEPGIRHAVAVQNATASLFGDGSSEMGDRIEALRDLSAQVAAGNLATLSDTLTAQALTLDATFTNLLAMARRHTDLEPFERIMRLAMKAQSQSRATVEALAKMHQPREQTVHHRHYHIEPDGKAVFVENAYGGMTSGSFGGQPHEAATTRIASPSAALPSPNPLGQPLPVARGQGAEAMPAPRVRSRKRRTGGES